MIKSAWAYRNGKRIMKECLEQQKAEKISFIERHGNKIYAEYGSAKTYANKKQAENKAKELRVLGYEVERSFKHPFTIILNQD